MVSPLSPKQLEFSTPDGASYETLSVRKSQRIPTYKRAASDEARAEVKSKKKRKVKKDKSASSVINRIWKCEDEISLLKGLADYKAERGLASKVEWEAFYALAGSSITAKFSREQIMNKIRKMKSRFHDHYEKIKQGIESHSTTFRNAEVYELAMTVWDENDQDVSKENEEVLDENEAAENGNTKEAQHSENGEEVVANGQELNDNGAQQNQRGKELLQEENEIPNGALNTVEKVSAEKASHDADDGVVKPSEKEKHDAHFEFCNVQDAFETLISHDLSDHRKRIQLEKLKKLGSGMRRKLSEEWTAICDRETKLKIRKLKFSATLAEAAKEN